MKIRAGLVFLLMFVCMNWSYASCSIFDCPSSDKWPTKHDSSAVSETISKLSGGTKNSLRVYVWRESGYIWLEVIAVSGDSLVSQNDFIIRQDGNLHLPIILMAPDVLQNGFIETSKILLLNLRQTPGLAKLNIQENFTLIGGVRYAGLSLDVPASATADGSSNDEPDVVDCSVLPYYENGVVYIPCTHVPNGNGGTDIYQTSWTIIPDREPLSLELHSIETFDTE